MSATDAAPASGATRPDVLLAFDGDCGFCQTAIDQIRRRAKPAIPAAPWQSLPSQLTQPHLERLDHEVILFAGTSVRCGGATALARFLGSSPQRRYRVATFLVRLPPLSLAAHGIYRWVARNRHRMPAGTPACSLPRTQT
ncbi:thiol-disulfide oxidoreductase DCC family protein [Streptomyces sp. NBC_00212]|uniref:thiol-disulfide oxidoreductase DCC family protein n=1 Tax=Streptomyces sp. NBC_00212 TaxID=2975684 RepID=UPI00324AB295